MCRALPPLLLLLARSSGQDPPPAGAPAAGAQQQQACDSWSPGGLALSSKNAGGSDTDTDTITVSIGNPISMNGALTAWHYVAIRAGETTLQIWRHGATPTGYELVCKTEVTTTKAGPQTAEISPPCQVEAGDFVGFWQAEAGVR